MAEAYAKLTRQPTACLGTRAVGAANLAIGLHTARQDSSPVVALLGQVAGRARHLESFQEADLEQMLSPLTKWAVEPATSDSLGDLTYAAVRLACEGRPGPVAVAYREDLLYELAPHRVYPPLRISRPHPAQDAVVEALAILRSAASPALLVGAGVLASDACQACVEFAEAEQVPVFASWRRPDAFPNDHPLYLGQTGLSALPSVVAALRSVDALLVVGCRLDENTTLGYSLPVDGGQLVHVDLDAGRLRPSLGGLGIVSDASAFLDAILSASRADPLAAPDVAAHAQRVGRLRAMWEREASGGAVKVNDGYADQFTVADQMRKLLPPGSVIASDAGNFSGWSARYLRWNEPHTFLGPISGAMGYAVPAAIGAQLARPHRQVVAVAGDGGFLMTAAELQTASREGTPIKVVVFDNGQYGTIRMHQQQQFPGRQIATRLGDVDFAALACSLGAKASTVTSSDDFPEAFHDAIANDAPSVVVVRVDPDQISVGTGPDDPVFVDRMPPELSSDFGSPIGT